jgi:hypothetical protein
MKNIISIIFSKILTLRLNKILEFFIPCLVAAIVFFNQVKSEGDVIINTICGLFYGFIMFVIVWFCTGFMFGGFKYLNSQKRIAVLVFYIGTFLCYPIVVFFSDKQDQALFAFVYSLILFSICFILWHGIDKINLNSFNIFKKPKANYFLKNQKIKIEKCDGCGGRGWVYVCQLCQSHEIYTVGDGEWYCDKCFDSLGEGFCDVEKNPCPLNC